MKTENHQPKPKVTCPVCNLVVALNTNGLIPRHRPRWRGELNTGARTVCFASYKTPQAVLSAVARYEAVVE